MVPAVWLSYQPWASLHHFWYLAVASMLLQALFSWWLLRRQLHHKLALFEPVKP